MDKSIRQRLEGELAKVREEVSRQGIRLLLAQGWMDLLNRAYDALLYHGVRFRELKVYKEEFPTADKPEHIHTVRDKWLQWFDRMDSDIMAAVRRKQMRQV